jgi:hypothetical protein
MRIRNLANPLVLVVMDQFTRRIIGFGVHRGIIDGVALCRMFQRAVRTRSLPKYLMASRSGAPESRLTGLATPTSG